MTPSNDLTPDAGTRKRDGSSITFSSPTTAVGVFNTPADAEAAVRALKEAGFDDAQIGVASREWSQRFANVNVGDQHAAERGAVAGAAIGGGVGAVLGIAGAMLIPGAAPLVAGSLLVSALVGGAAGAAGGTFAGPFIAMGFSEDDAAEHGRAIEHGKTVLLVYESDRQRRDEARDVMVANGAFDSGASTSP